MTQTETYNALRFTNEEIDSALDGMTFDCSPGAFDSALETVYAITVNQPSEMITDSDLEASEEMPSFGEEN